MNAVIPKIIATTPITASIFRKMFFIFFSSPQISNLTYGYLPFSSRYRRFRLWLFDFDLYLTPQNAQIIQ